MVERVRGGIAFEALDNNMSAIRTCDPANGRAEAAPKGNPKRKGKPDPQNVLFAEVIEQDGDITILDLSAALFDATRVEVDPNPSTIRNVCARSSLRCVEARCRALDQRIAPLSEKGSSVDIFTSAIIVVRQLLGRMPQAAKHPTTQGMR